MPCCRFAVSRIDSLHLNSLLLIRYIWFLVLGNISLICCTTAWLKEIGLVLWLSRNKITARSLSVFLCYFSADSSTLCYTIVRAPSSLKGDRQTCVRVKRRNGEPLHAGCIVHGLLLFACPCEISDQLHCQDACANTRAIPASYFYPYIHYAPSLRLL